MPFVALLVSASQTELAPGQCSGIGWGRELTGWDAVGFSLIFVGPFVATIWLVGHGVLAAVQIRRARRNYRSH